MAERRLSCHHHVNDPSHSRHASRSVNRDTYYCNLLKQITSIESATNADLWTWHGDIIQACVDHFDHNYLLYRSVDYGKRASTVRHNFQANTYVHKEEQCQAVLGLLENVECSCITITKYYQWSSWSNESSWHFSHCITLLRNHEVMRTFCFLKTKSYHRRARFLKSCLYSLSLKTRFYVALRERDDYPVIVTYKQHLHVLQ